MKKMSKEFLSNLIKGASILSCGGGVCYAQQKEKLEELCKSFNVEGLRLINPGEIEKKELFLTIAELGVSDAPLADRKELRAALDLYEKKRGVVISGIIPGEIGQEVVTLEAALILNLPIVDSDLAGCRAVPRLSDLSQLRVNPSFTMTPLVVVLGSGEVCFVKKQENIKDDERLLRNLVADSDSESLMFLGGSVSGKEIKERLNFQSYSFAEKVGRKISSGCEISDVVGRRVLFPPLELVVKGINERTGKGFVRKIVHLKNQDKNYEILVENEFMRLEGDDIEIGFPDLISVVDPDSLIGKDSSSLKVGQRVVVVCWERFHFWQ